MIAVKALGSPQHAQYRASDLHEKRRRPQRGLQLRHSSPPPSPAATSDPPRSPGDSWLQVADETHAEFAKGLADAMKRKMDKSADRLGWEQRLEAAATTGGMEVSP